MEKSVGGVIVKDGKVVVVKQQKGTFSLPKGHLEGDERLIDTAYREIYEETGLKKEDLKLIRPLESYTRPDGKTGNPKEISMFLFSTDKSDLNPIDKDNPEAVWIDIDQVYEKLSYKEDKEFFLKHKKEFKNLIKK